MAKDIFNHEVKIGGAWKIDDAILTIAGGENLLAVGCNINYSRLSAHYAPINQDKRYLMAGPGEGTISIDSIVGPTAALKTFLDTYGDVCSVAGDSNAISIKPAGVSACDETTNQRMEFIATGALLSNLALSVQNSGGLSMVTSQLMLKILCLQIKYV